MKTMAESLEKASKCTLELRLFLSHLLISWSKFDVRRFSYTKKYIHIQKKEIKPKHIIHRKWWKHAKHVTVFFLLTGKYTRALYIYGENKIEKTTNLTVVNKIKLHCDWMSFLLWGVYRLKLKQMMYFDDVMGSWELLFSLLKENSDFFFNLGLYIFTFGCVNDSYLPKVLESIQQYTSAGSHDTAAGATT